MNRQKAIKNEERDDFREISEFGLFSTNGGKVRILESAIEKTNNKRLASRSPSPLFSSPLTLSRSGSAMRVNTSSVELSPVVELAEPVAIIDGITATSTHAL